jgi:hypothetical protein
MMLFKSFASIDNRIYSATEKQIGHLLGPAMKCLRHISYLQFAEFDFRQAFMRDNGLKLLFEMSILDPNWQVKRLPQD